VTADTSGAHPSYACPAIAAEGSAGMVEPSRETK